MDNTSFNGSCRELDTKQDLRSSKVEKAKLLSFGLGVGAFMGLYKLLPNVRANPYRIVIGALTSGSIMYSITYWATFFKLV